VKGRIGYLVVATAAILSMAHITLARDGKADSIAINAPQSVTAGTNVFVEITIMNVSDHQILLSASNFPNLAERNFHVDVFNSQGELATRTQYGKALRQEDQGPGPRLIMTGRLLQTYLAPGETHKERTCISSLFDLKPGVYTVKVWQPDSHVTNPPTWDSPPEASDLRKPIAPHATPTTNPPPLKDKDIARSNTITITVTP
jgi:hypothetical protein